MRIDDEDRFDRFRLISWRDQDRLARSTVMVVGVGAIGNEAIKNLALLGIGHIVLVDRDRVELSNLSRSILFRTSDRGRFKAEVAAESVRSIHPGCRTTPIVGDIQFDVGLSWFDQADIVLGCLDNREARLWVNRCCWRVGTSWIDAGIQEIQGALQMFQARKAPCYECGMKEIDYRLISARYSCPGMGRDDVPLGQVPTTPTISSIIGAWQSQMAVKALHELSLPWGSSLVVNGLSDSTYRIQLQEKEGCLSHEMWELDHKIGAEGKEWTLQQLLEFASNQWQGEWSLMLERRLATRLACETCQRTVELENPVATFGAGEGRCPECHAWMTPTWIDSIEFDSKHALKRPIDLGIPNGDWVRIRQEKYVKIIGLPSP